LKRSLGNIARNCVSSKERLHADQPIRRILKEISANTAAVFSVQITLAPPGYVRNGENTRFDALTIVREGRIGRASAASSQPVPEWALSEQTTPSG
jgi:hypothetical protein